MTAMHVLVTGANGQLGQCLADQLSEQGIAHTMLSREQADINDTVVLSRLIADHDVTVIINAAAYTAVDKAESEVALAQRVNTQGAEALAKLCGQYDIPLLHVSTDYVFAGDADRPYNEVDATAPTGVYGSTKLAGEKAIALHCPKHIILRTAWVFSEYGNNFLKTMLRLGGERDSLSVVVDQIGCPTYAGDIAAALVSIASQLQQRDENTNGVADYYGIYHYSGNSAVSWHGFAAAIFEQAQQQGLLAKRPTLAAIATEDYPTPAARPAYSVLDCREIAAEFAVLPSDWRMAVGLVLSKLK